MQANHTMIHLEAMLLRKKPPEHVGSGVAEIQAIKLQKIVGSASAVAARAMKRQGRKLRRDSTDADIYPDPFAKQNRKGCGAEDRPMTAEELSEFVGSALSPRTVKTRQSHLKKNEKLLRSEFPRRCRGKDAKDVLSMVSAETIERVSARLSRANIRTGANYLPSWFNDDCSTELTGAAKKRRRRCVRALNKCRGSPRQAVEFPLRELIHHAALFDHAPLTHWGPMYPRLTVAIAGLLMLRGLTSRSPRAHQVKVKKDTVDIQFGVRKNGQSQRHIRSLPLGCVCHVLSGQIRGWLDQGCPHCLTERYVIIKGDKIASIFSFVTSSVTP